MRRTVVLAALAAALVLPAYAWAAGAGVTEADEEALEIEAGEDVTDPSREGCRKVDIAKTSKDIFGFVVYRFHQVKRWCWSFPQITSVTISTYVSDVDPNMEYEGIIGVSGGYFTWCCADSRSGHHSFRQGKFKNCILWFPCTRTEYPWVRITAKANGTFSWSRGLS